jgi:hypothetical protein
MKAKNKLIAHQTLAEAPIRMRCIHATEAMKNAVVPMSFHTFKSGGRIDGLSATETSARHVKARGISVQKRKSASAKRNKPVWNTNTSDAPGTTLSQIHWIYATMGG